MRFRQLPASTYQGQLTWFSTSFTLFYSVCNKPVTSLASQLNTCMSGYRLCCLNGEFCTLSLLSMADTDLLSSYPGVQTFAVPTYLRSFLPPDLGVCSLALGASRTVSLRIDPSLIESSFSWFSRAFTSAEVRLFLLSERSIVAASPSLPEGNRFDVQCLRPLHIFLQSSKARMLSQRTSVMVTVLRYMPQARQVSKWSWSWFICYREY